MHILHEMYDKAKQAYDSPEAQHALEVAKQNLEKGAKIAFDRSGRTGKLGKLFIAHLAVLDSLKFIVNLESKSLPQFRQAAVPLGVDPRGPFGF